MIVKSLIRNVAVVSCLVLSAQGAPPAAPGKPVAVRWWGHAMVSIETWWDLTVVIDPYDEGRTGYTDSGVSGDLVLVTHEHADHNNVKLVKGKPAVVRGLDDKGEPNAIDLVFDRRPDTTKPRIAETAQVKGRADHAVRIRSIASDHDDASGRKRGRNAMFVVEVDGVRILHCGDLGQPKLTRRQLKAIGEIDVALVPVGGVYTVDGGQAGAIVGQLRPRFVIPIHYKTPPPLKIGLSGAGEFLKSLPDGCTIAKPKGNTLAVSRGRGPTREKPTAVVLRYVPWKMPAELAGLFERMSAAARHSQSVFAPLTARQMNHRPSNGTHTPRWNAEHLMGRQLGFFTRIYSQIDPSVPHVDLNPAQHPPDYKAAHADWSGREETRQMARADALVRRFAYLLDGIDLDGKPKSGPWTIRGLCRQMERHFEGHTANVEKKFKLPDWPAK